MHVVSLLSNIKFNLLKNSIHAYSPHHNAISSFTLSLLLLNFPCFSMQIMLIECSDGDADGTNSYTFSITGDTYQSFALSDTTPASNYNKELHMTKGRTASNGK